MIQRRWLTQRFEPTLVGGLLLATLLTAGLGAFAVKQSVDPITRIDHDHEAVLLRRTTLAVADVNRVRTPAYARGALATMFDGCPIDDSGSGLLPYPPTLTRSWKLMPSAVLPIDAPGEAFVTDRAKKSAAEVARQLQHMGWVFVNQDADFGEIDLVRRVDGHRVEIWVAADEDSVYATISTYVPHVCSLAFWPG